MYKRWEIEKQNARYARLAKTAITVNGVGISTLATLHTVQEALSMQESEKKWNNVEKVLFM